MLSFCRFRVHVRSMWAGKSVRKEYGKTMNKWYDKKC